MANHFNDLVLHTLKQISIRLDRIDEKADKADLKVIHEKLGTNADKAD